MVVQQMTAAGQVYLNVLIGLQADSTVEPVTHAPPS